MREAASEDGASTTSRKRKEPHKEHKEEREGKEKNRDHDRDRERDREREKRKKKKKKRIEITVSETGIETERIMTDEARGITGMMITMIGELGTMQGIEIERTGIGMATGLPVTGMKTGGATVDVKLHELIITQETGMRLPRRNEIGARLCTRRSLPKKRENGTETVTTKGLKRYSVERVLREKITQVLL